MIFFDGPVAHAGAGLIAALAVGMVAYDLRPGEGTHLGKLVRPWALPACVPALWMALQASPMPIADFAHPIWEAAGAALNMPVVGAISIDPGITLAGLGRYLSIIAVVFVAAAVAVDRRRAEWLLVGLSGLTGLLALGLVVAELLRFGSSPTSQGAVISLRALCAVGVVVSAAAAVYVLEQFGAQRRGGGPGTAMHAAVMLAPMVAFFICCFSIARSSSPQAVFATSCGIAVFVLIVIARRLGFGPRPALAVSAAALFVAVSVSLSGYGHGDPFLRFASAGRAPAAERMMEDSEILGSGAGTFAALRPIYGTAKDVSADPAPPTAAAAMVIELGRPMWVVIILLAAAGAAALLRGALARGRDWVYPAAGAGCIVLLTIESFTDATLFNGAVATMAAAVTGLGLGQSVTRTVE